MHNNRGVLTVRLFCAWIVGDNGMMLTGGQFAVSTYAHSTQGSYR